MECGGGRGTWRTERGLNGVRMRPDAGQEGDKLRLLSAKAAVPHIFRRQRGVPIALIPRCSGGPSGVVLLRAYRSLAALAPAPAPGYWTRAGHAVCAVLSVAWPARHMNVAETQRVDGTFNTRATQVVGKWAIPTIARGQ